MKSDILDKLAEAMYALKTHPTSAVWYCGKTADQQTPMLDGKRKFLWVVWLEVQPGVQDGEIQAEDAHCWIFGALCEQ